MILADGTPMLVQKDASTSHAPTQRSSTSCEVERLETSLAVNGARTASLWYGFQTFAAQEGTAQVKITKLPSSLASRIPGSKDGREVEATDRKAAREWGWLGVYAPVWG